MPRLDISRLRRNRSIYLKLGFLLSLAFVTYAFTLEVKPIDYRAGYFAETDIDDLMVVPPRIPPERPPVPPPPELQKIEPEVLEDTPEFIEEPLPLDIPAEPIDNPQPQTSTEVAIAPPPLKPPLPPEKEVKEIEIIKTYDWVEEMPRFPGCEEEDLSKAEKKMCSDRALMKFIVSRIKYPALAKEIGIEGTVFIEFVINKKGKPEQFKIIRSPGKLLSNEALRVIKQMPNWKPGKQRLKPVAVRYKMPIIFNFED